MSIIDTVPGAITVYADQVKVEDQIFDDFGTAWTVVASATENGRQIIVRRDGFTEHHPVDDQVVIVPGDGDLGRNLDKVSSGSRNGYIETGRYSSENEEREINPESHTDETQEV